jgi:hypothetical protein
VCAACSLRTPAHRTNRLAIAEECKPRFLVRALIQCTCPLLRRLVAAGFDAEAPGDIVGAKFFAGHVGRSCYALGGMPNVLTEYTLGRALSTTVRRFAGGITSDRVMEVMRPNRLIRKAKKGVLGDHYKIPPVSMRETAIRVIRVCRRVAGR